MIVVRAARITNNQPVERGRGSSGTSGSSQHRYCGEKTLLPMIAAESEATAKPAKAGAHAVATRSLPMAGAARRRSATTNTHASPNTAPSTLGVAAAFSAGDSELT